MIDLGWQVPLWDAINKLIMLSGGHVSCSVVGRQHAVVEIEGIVRDAMRKAELDHRCNGNHADTCPICKTIEDGRDGGGCDYFSRGKPGGDCDGDVHYECKECVSFRSVAYKAGEKGGE